MITTRTTVPAQRQVDSVSAAGAGLDIDVRFAPALTAGSASIEAACARIGELGLPVSRRGLCRKASFTG